MGHPVFVHHQSAIPNCISLPKQIRWHPSPWRLSREQYRADKTPTKRPTKPSTCKHRMVICLKVPYISERLNHRITTYREVFVFKNVIAHKPYTLRQALSHTSTERKCTRDKCPISNTGLCLRRNAVYQLTSNSCDQQYIGSTTRFIHDRVKEHFKGKTPLLKKHIYSCQNYKDYKGIDVKIIMSENDTAYLRLYEAFYIRKCKPTLNSREECSELADLLFQYFNAKFRK